MMKLVHKDTKKFENNNWHKVYECEVNEFKDFISLVNSLEDNYGPVEEILCIKRGKDNIMLSYDEYDTLEELNSNFDKNNFMDYHSYKFSAKDRYIDFMYETKTKKLNVYSYEGSLGKKEYHKEKIKYYEDEYGNIVRYDGNKRMLYTYDHKLDKWVKNRELTSDFHSYDSEYTLIDYDEHNGLKR